MKTFVADIIPKIQKFSQQLDNLTLLINQHWVVIDDIENTKNVYIFRKNNELLISQNGKVEKAKWEYLGHNSLLIDRKDESFLFKHGFFDENILALKIDSKDEYVFLVNETKYDKELNSLVSVLDFLNIKYVNPQIKSQIHDSIGLRRDDLPINSTHDVELDVIFDKPIIRRIDDSWSLMTGKYIRYEIAYSNKLQSSYMKILRNNTYTFDLKKYYETEKECILELFNLLKK